MKGVKKWYCLDTETSNSEINISKHYTRVWLWDIYDPYSRKHINGFDVSTLMYKIFSFDSCVFYIHNLKFDGEFILSYLLQHGFYYSDQKFNGSINALITDRNVWYCIKIHYNNKTYEFRDSLKKIVTSLRDAAKSFGLSYGKGEIEYRKHRDYGYKPTSEEIKYIHVDTEIMGDILKDFYDNGLTGLTNASDAMKEYKRIIGKQIYDMYFPKLDNDVDDFIRASYKGGFCWLNPKYKNKELNKVYTYDVKSMYPSVMHDTLLPHGHPVWYDGEYIYDELMPLYIQEIMVDCKLKYGHIPSIQRKTFMSLKLDYLYDTGGEMSRMVLTSIDLENLYEDYDIFEINYIQGYKFRASKNLFRPYVEKYFKLKESSHGSRKQIYKIMLNALYGKFAMGTIRQKKIPTIDNEIIKFKLDDPEVTSPVYTAVASFITAQARKKLLTAIRSNFENFIYCDTDSIHLTSPCQNIDEGFNLGQFAIENGYYDNNITITEISKAKYIGQKCYMLLGNGKNGEWIKKKIAGCTPEFKKYISFDNFKEGLYLDADLEGKFRPTHVRGGVLLVPVQYELKQR